MFDSINDAQLVWYQFQLHLDKKDQFEMLRDVAEHNAMFMNPEGVQQVRDARDNSFETSDEDFSKLLENTFGRSIDLNGVNKKHIDPKEILEQEKAQLNSQYSDIIDMDLDEIEFIPLK